MTERDAIVSPIAKYASIWVVSAVAPRMSPPTPVEWSPSKNSRSPASDARNVVASISRSVFHCTNWSSGGIDDTNPPTSPRRSIVARSIVMCLRRWNAATAWHASWTATA